MRYELVRVNPNGAPIRIALMEIQADERTLRQIKDKLEMEASSGEKWLLRPARG